MERRWGRWGSEYVGGSRRDVKDGEVEYLEEWVGVAVGGADAEEIRMKILFG